MSTKTKNIIFLVLFILAAVGSSSIFILYNLIIRYKVIQMDEVWNFFSFVHPDSMVNLAPMLREILDGHWWVSDGKTFEHIGAPNLWSFLNPIILFPLILLIKNISYVFLIGTFLAALATFIIFYFLAKEITRHRIFSLLFTIVFSVATLIWEFLLPVKLENLKILVRAILPLGSPTTDVLMSRYVSFSILPAWPFFALVFLSILRSLKYRKIFWTILSGILLGFLAYMVLTDFIYILIGLTTLLIITLISKNFKSSKQIFWILMIAAGVASGLLFNFFAIRTLPWADEFYRRLSGEFTHLPRFSFWKEYIAYVVFALLVWLWGKRHEQKIESWFIMSFILAVIVLLNIQVLTGFNPAPTVWFEHQAYFGFALGFLVLFFWVYNYCAHKSKKLKFVVSVIGIAIIILLTVRTIYTNFYVANSIYKHYYIPKPISRSFEWLNNNTPRDSVVVTPSLITNGLLPVFTHNGVLLPAAITSPASQEEIIDRYLLSYALFGVRGEYLERALHKSGEKIDDFAQNHENNLMILMFDSLYAPQELDAFFHGGKARNKVPEEVTDELVNRLNKYPKKIDFLLSQYRLDYIYLGPYERRLSSIDFDKVNFLEKVYTDEGIQIYKIITKNNLY